MVLEVLADDPEAEEDIKRLATPLGHGILTIESEGGRVEFLIKRRQAPSSLSREDQGILHE